MALVKCVDCGRDVSDRAKACPNCGCPIESRSTENTIRQEEYEIDKQPVAPQMDDRQDYEGEQTGAFTKEKAIKLAMITGILTVVLVVIALISVQDNTSKKPDNYWNNMGGQLSSDYQNQTPTYSANHSNAGQSTKATQAVTTQPAATKNNSSNNNHFHYYTSKVTKESTCSVAGVRTYSCSCGDSYTEAIAMKSHSYNTATCTTPKTCKNCGATDGNPYGHNYSSYSGKCSRCDQMDPKVEETLSKCSLSLPSLPQTIKYKKYDGSTYSMVSVTAITYSFEYEGDGTVSLVARFSGTKTYDYRGSGQSDDCKIGWKLYDEKGNVYNTGTFSSPNVAMGESFADQEDDLIFNFNDAAPGAYRLEILDVN